MKSLAESILSSTNSGKNRKIDVEYLLTHGFERDIHISPKTRIKHKETGYFLRIFGDKIAVDIFRDEKSFVTQLVVSTVEDLDLVIEWFKARARKANSEIEKIRKELFKNLEEIKYF